MHTIHAFTPSDIISLHHGQPMTTSLKVAELFGKRHDDVLKKVRNIECSSEFNARNFAAVEYIDGKGEKRPAYEMTKDGFIFVVMGFTGKKAAAIKEAYINAFNWMADQLRQAAIPSAKQQDDAMAVLNYAHMLGQRDREAIQAEAWLESRFMSLTQELENLRQDMRTYHARQRSNRDIVSHMQLHGHWLNRG
ncbi:Rha family transcriptional regulator [Aeromonas caviae]|uniref:Rha family transcriptional regulator n=1 Tax=Aeromonas caviae TaxID=648 RepID=UPI002B4668ED|nr:Rha family transcriptional regulator [Aeromonas caviae]